MFMRRAREGQRCAICAESRRCVRRHLRWLTPRIRPSSTRFSFWLKLATNCEIDVVVLIMTDPRFALHEVNALLHECPAPSRVEPWNVRLVEDYAGDADAVEF